MAYVAPTLGTAGLVLPSYNDILNQLISQARSIFGTDIYLANDSQDYQYLSAISSALNDAMQLCQLAVNNQSPSLAIGSALDSLIKLNGLQRLAATYSTCLVTITGAAGTVIPVGVVQDVSGYLWDLPANTTIPTGGILTATVTCETSGAITAAIGDIQNIVTPQYGWTSVTNPATPTVGVPVETDTELRLRQGTSVSLPSQTPINGTTAAVQAVDGVTRANIYENNTSSTDSNSVPAHSIAPVVEGGTDDDIAAAIAIGKTEGCGTYGTTSVTLPLTYSIGGTTNFSRPIYDTIGVDITVLQLTGYTQAIQTQITTNITNYLNTLPIGTSVQASSLYFTILSATPDMSNPTFAITSLTINKNGGSFGSSVTVAWNEVAEAGTITVSGGF
jgi:uncharacterized phage protein gp47/JayE